MFGPRNADKPEDWNKLWLFKQKQKLIWLQKLTGMKPSHRAAWTNRNWRDPKPDLKHKDPLKSNQITQILTATDFTDRSVCWAIGSALPLMSLHAGSRNEGTTQSHRFRHVENFWVKIQAKEEEFSSSQLCQRHQITTTSCPLTLINSSKEIETSTLMFTGNQSHLLFDSHH